jgi:acyl-CoA synthetase (AMP-forming)/AMP-acid ligase II
VSLVHANISLTIWNAAAASPESIAVRDLGTGRQLTYRELRNAAANIAAGFLERGLRPGDRVAMLLHNSCEYVTTFFGALAAGMVVVPLNTRLTVQDFSHMLTDAGAAAVVTDPPFIAMLRSEPSLELPLVVDVTGKSSGAISLTELSVPSDAEPYAQDPEDLCSLMYTSGTTGSPKAVMLSHGAWSSVSDTCVELLGFKDGIAVMHPAPLTHGAGFLMLPTFRHAGINLLCRSFDAADTASRIHSGEAEGMFLVPSMIRMLLDVLPEDWEPASTFGWVYYAGSPIDSSTFLEATDRLAGKLVQSFAQMEAPMFLTSLSSADHLDTASGATSDLSRSAGRLIRGREIRVVDADGHDVEPGEVGEIWATAPQLMSGYWNRSEETAKTLAQGWLHTGDMGRFDTDGYLFLVDRVKDMIVTGGSNVYAREVEDVLVAVPGVERAAVVGLPHRIWGEEVTAVLVASKQPVPADDAIQEHCRQSLAGYKVPKRIIWVDELPTNAYGKVLKRELRTSLAGQPAGQVSTV